MVTTLLKRLGLTSAWSQELGLAALALVVGFALMPLLIFSVGVSILGRYEGASPTRLYDNLFQGLAMGSTASWLVVLGPYGFYLLFKLLRVWWRASVRLA
jgi:hypothetical protein